MTPLALLALGFALGIVLRESTGLGWYSCAGLVVAATLLLWRFGLRRERLGLASLLHAIALGALAAAASHPVTPDALVGGKPVTMTARVVEPPERVLGRTHLVVALEQLARVTRARGLRVRKASGRVRVAVPGDVVEPLATGDRVRLRARLLAPHGFHEPESPDPERRFAERGVIAVAGVASPASLARLSFDGPATGGGAPSSRGAAGATRAALERWRERLLARVARVLDGERRALVESLVLGERGGISAALDEAFRRAGVTHVLSVSGLHLAIAGFLAFVGLRRVLLLFTPLCRRVAVVRIAAAAAIPATGIYTLLTGAAVATVRSCLATWLVLLGVATMRPASAQGALALGALQQHAASPLSLYSPSLQLSFAAALGMVLVGVPLAKKVVVLAGTWLDGAGRFARLVRGAIGLTCASMAALLFTSPITAWHFGQAAPAGLWANLVVVPLAELWVLPVGLTGCVLSSLPSVGEVLLRVAGVGAGVLAAVVRWLAAHAPEGFVPAPRLAETLLFYTAVGALAVWLRTSRPAAIRTMVAALALLALALAGRVAGPRLFPSLRVDFLDIGQGDAVLVTLPDGKRLLVDGGGSFDARFDPGAQVLVPWLRRMGIDRIDVVVMTHPHPDHANGLPSVVAALPVGEVWTSGVASPLPALQRLEEIAAARSVPVMRPHALEGGGATIRVLHPIDDEGRALVPPRGWSENDGSIVLRVEYAGRALLLTGDVERRAEARLVAQAAAHPEALRADVLKAGHHCSRTSTTQPFLEAVRPSLLVCSVGASNPWGFPAPEVTARAEALGAAVRRTDREGAVTVTVTRTGEMIVDTAR